MTGQTSLYTDLFLLLPRITGIDFLCLIVGSFLPFIHSFIHSDRLSDSQAQPRILHFFKGDEETKGSGWVEVNLLERFLVYSYNIIYTNNQSNMLNSCFPLFSFSSLFALFLFFNKLQGRCKPHTLSISGSANSI